MPRLLLVVLPLCLLGSASAGDKPDKKPEKKDRETILKTFADELIALAPGKDPHPESFVMGSAKGGYPSERPAHKVVLKYSFALAKYEVTQELYEAVVGHNPSKWKGPRNAVEMVTWD